MKAGKLRPGMRVFGRQIKMVTPFIMSGAGWESTGQQWVTVNFGDGDAIDFAAEENVKVDGYVERLPAGPVRKPAVSEHHRVRVSDGRWAGEAGGWRIDQISRMAAWDLDRRPANR
ncbi:hypothetical protein E1091_03475 [Micromonospora fluostatini]|uniref:Transposase n=1 Tax=Micromonospora fluostatini TaxID=1629071 RepID=A0ABY2DMY2_9ACTN|nr:hypothetical protein E1091_03475 [Micromonospora fluostatini]